MYRLVVASFIPFLGPISSASPSSITPFLSRSGPSHTLSVVLGIPLFLRILQSPLTFLKYYFKRAYQTQTQNNGL